MCGTGRVQQPQQVEGSEEGFAPTVDPDVDLRRADRDDVPELPASRILVRVEPVDPVLQGPGISTTPVGVRGAAVPGEFLVRLTVPGTDCREPVREFVGRQILVVELRRTGQMERGREDVTYLLRVRRGGALGDINSEGGQNRRSRLGGGCTGRGSGAGCRRWRPRGRWGAPGDVAVFVDELAGEPTRSVTIAKKRESISFWGASAAVVRSVWAMGFRPWWSQVRVTGFGRSAARVVCSHSVVPSQVKSTRSTNVSPSAPRELRGAAAQRVVGVAPAGSVRGGDLDEPVLCVPLVAPGIQLARQPGLLAHLATCGGLVQVPRDGCVL